jgi:hypothetical protein
MIAQIYQWAENRFQMLSMMFVFRISLFSSLWLHANNIILKQRCDISHGKEKRIFQPLFLQSRNNAQFPIIFFNFIISSHNKLAFYLYYSGTCLGRVTYFSKPVHIFIVLSIELNSTPLNHYFHFPQIQFLNFYFQILDQRSSFYTLGVGGVVPSINILSYVCNN